MIFCNARGLKNNTARHTLVKETGDKVVLGQKVLTIMKREGGLELRVGNEMRVSSEHPGQKDGKLRHILTRLAGAKPYPAQPCTLSHNASLRSRSVLIALLVSDLHCFHFLHAQKSRMFSWRRVKASGMLAGPVSSMFA